MTLARPIIVSIEQLDLGVRVECLPFAVSCERCGVGCREGRSGPQYVARSHRGYTERTAWLCLGCAPSVWAAHYAGRAAVRHRLALIQRSRELRRPARDSDLSTTGVQLGLWST